MTEKAQYSRQHFSLAELIVAMTLLTLLMGLLFKFIIQAQKLWQVDEANARIYQNSRTIYNILGRDIQGMLTSDTPGRRIKYTDVTADMSTPAPATATNIAAWVTASGIGASELDVSKTLEVGYCLDGTSLIRFMSTSGTIPDTPSHWDFFNAEPSAWAATWQPEGTTIAEGVSTFTLRFFDSEMNVVSGVSDKTPAFALVEFELFDPDAIVGGVTILAEKARTLRRMSKMIFLSQED